MQQPSETARRACGPPSGRVALVTGGAGLLGETVVRRLAARGDAVAIHCHRSLAKGQALATELASGGGMGLAVTANLRDEGAVRALVQRVADHFGRIDALVACAGVWRPTPLENLTADDLRAHFEVNCIGTFVAAQEAAGFMLHQDSGGAIVMIADGRLERPTAGDAAALPSHGAIPALARGLAVELAARDPRVRVNCVMTGPPGRPDPPDADAIARTVLSLLDDGLLTGACVPAGGDASAAP